MKRDYIFTFLASNTINFDKNTIQESLSKNDNHYILDIASNKYIFDKSNINKIWPFLSR